MHLTTNDYIRETYYEILDVVRNLKATEYKLLNGYDMNSFQTLVESYLQDGWRCQGGVSVIPVTEAGGMTPVFFQAVVRLTEENGEEDLE